jgi:C-terminal processing protease CtpA/Prc
MQLGTLKVPFQDSRLPIVPHHAMFQDVPDMFYQWLTLMPSPSPPTKYHHPYTALNPTQKRLAFTFTNAYRNPQMKCPLLISILTVSSLLASQPADASDEAPKSAAPAAALSTSAPAERMLTAKEALRDLRILKLAFSKLHPGLLRYQTDAEFEASFAAASTAVQNGISLRRFFAHLSKLAADVRCGHTWLNPRNQPASVQAELFGTPRLLPVRLDYVEGRFIVYASMNREIIAGDELVAIGDRTMASLVSELKPMLRADGANTAKHNVALSHRTEDSALDFLLPIIMPVSNGRLQLKLSRVNSDGTSADLTVSVPPVTWASRQAAMPSAKDKREPWAFRIDGEVAYWDMPSFSYFDDKEQAAVFADVNARFDELRAKRVTKLIVDIRANEGGAGAVAQRVLTGLLQKPFTSYNHHGESAYERVPYELARFLDTWDFSFFDRTGAVVKTGGRNLLMKAHRGMIERFEPSPNAFRGKVILLVGPENSSSTFILAQQLQDARAATVVGEPTGGNKRGLNGGELTWLTLPSSSIAVDIPLIAWVADGNPANAGVVPTVLAPRTVADLRAGRDPALLAAQALLK